jgi:transaldolase
LYSEELKFSLWLDFIERDFLENDFQALLDKGNINGATSNPAIFEAAINGSKAYAKQLEQLKGKPAKEIYEAIALEDIAKAADMLRPLFDKGDDGYVSIEVDPFLCDDAQGTIEEGMRLFKALNRPNVMIKVPATMAGYEAMEKLVANNIPVNATLIFTKEEAIACATAFSRGLAKATQKVDTVISVFVSRVDRALDPTLTEMGLPIGLAGIYNAAAAYNAIEALHVPNCRTLFASTGVKSDGYLKDHYIAELVAYNSVNTAPLATIESFEKQKFSGAKLPLSEDQLNVYFDLLARVGIDLEATLATLKKDGLEAFKKSFQAILDAAK